MFFSTYCARKQLQRICPSTCGGRRLAMPRAGGRGRTSFREGVWRPLGGPWAASGARQGLFPSRQPRQAWAGGSTTMIEAEVDDAAAMASDEQERELARLEACLEALGRQEEALISLAFDNGVDILRRSAANPACVLGLRARVAAPAARRPRSPAAAPVAGGPEAIAAAAE